MTNAPDPSRSLKAPPPLPQAAPSRGVVAVDYASGDTRRGTRRLRRRPDLLVWALGGFGWVIVGVLLMGALTGLAMASGIRIMGGLGPFTGVLLLAAAARLSHALRRSQANSVVAYLEQAVRLNLPLPQMLAAAEAGERGRVRVLLHRLRDALLSGTPLGISLQETVPGLPPRALGQIASGERLGKLPEALHRVVRREQHQRWRDPEGGTRGIFLRWYPAALLLTLFFMSALFAVFVMPKYEQLFKDFRLPLPPITQWTLWAGVWAGPVLAVVSAVALLVICGNLASTLFSPERGTLGSPLAPLTDRLVWVTPVAHGIARDRGLADSMHVAADALEGGHPLETAVEEASQLRINAVVANRMRLWAALLNQGLGVADAARQARLPSLVSGMLGTAHSGESAAEVFRFLGRYYDARFSRAAALLHGALVPGLALIVGSLVACVALAMYLPLLRLMDTLSNSLTWTP